MWISSLSWPQENIRHLLAKEQDKKEIQEGLIKACDVIDLIIEILRGSQSVKDAKACLTQGITENIKFKSKISKKDGGDAPFYRAPGNCNPGNASL